MSRRNYRKIFRKTFKAFIFLVVFCLVGSYFYAPFSQWQGNNFSKLAQWQPEIREARADTSIFYETCNSASAVPLNQSTGTSTGMTWSSKITLYGSPTQTIRSGTARCGASADAAGGAAYTMNAPLPSTDAYYVDAIWYEDGTVASSDSIGFILNYIDASNYYACQMEDDVTPEVTIIKVAGGVGSQLVRQVNQTIGPLDNVRCTINYSGANPTITFRNVTDSVDLATATDSSSPLTKTGKAGVFCGATPAFTGDTCDNNLWLDDIRVYTVPAKPTLTTTNPPADPYNQTTATLWGNISSTGGENVTGRGFAYGQTSGLDGEDTATTTDWGSYGTGDFSKATSDLTCNTQYYVRAWAQNVSGTSTGAIYNFTTHNCSPEAPVRYNVPFRDMETLDPTPDFDFSADDPEAAADLVYQIIIDNDYNFSSPIVNCTSVGGGTCSVGSGGFVNTENGGDTSPFTRNQKIRFTPSTSFSDSAANTAYFWRMNAKDDTGSGGSGCWGATSTIASFRVNSGLANSRFVQTTDNQFSANTFSGTKVDTGSHRVRLSTGGVNTYSYLGVTSSDENPKAYESQVDVFPFNGSTANRNTYLEASDAEYVKIGTSDNDPWNIAAAPKLDEIFIWNTFNLSDDPALISQIDFVFEGTIGLTANVSLYVLKAPYHASGWEVTANWTQVGTSQSFTGGAEGTITKSLTTNIADYIDADGDIVWGIYEDTSEATVAVDYIKMDVTVSAPTTGYTRSRPLDFDWVSSMSSWNTLTWTEDETLGTVATQLWYASSTAKGDPSDGTACDTPIPDSALSGNSSWFASGPVDLSGLATTTYNRICARAKLTDVSGTPYLNDWTISWTGRPKVTTNAASDLTQTTARLNGFINSIGTGNATQHGFAWGTNATLANGNTATTTLGSKTGTGSFYSDLSSLTCDITYYFRAYATNSSGTGYGTILNFNYQCPATLKQAAYLFENTTSISTGDFNYPKGDSFSDQTDAKNTPRTNVKIGERMLLRVNIENSSASSPATTTFKLRLGTGGGCPSSCSWSDVTDTSAIALAPALLGEMGNWSEADVYYPKIATTTMGWSVGRYVIGTSTITTAPVVIAANNSTELVFGLDTSRASPSTQYYFQVYNAGQSQALDAYNQYPSLTIVSSANDLKRYSKGVLNAAPAAGDASSSLPYFLDNEAYTNLTADDTGTSTVKLTNAAYEKLYSQFEVSGSKIYYTWQELDNTTNCSAAACNQIWLGASNLDGTGTTTTKLTNTGYHKYSPQLQIIGSKIYYVWYERDGADQRQIWLASSNLDGTGTTTKKLTSTALNKYTPQFQIIGSKAYYTWTEVDAAAKQQIWLGTSNLDGTGTTTVKLTNTAYIKYFPQFQVLDSKIYYTWYATSSDSVKNQIWHASSNLDGTGTTTTQLTNTAFDKTYPQFQVVGSKIYYTWQELDNTTNCSTAACNQVWLASSNLDGSGTTTAKFISKAYHQQGPQLQVIGSKIYYTWSEDAGGNYYQVWLASSNLDGTGTTTAKLTNSGNTKNGPQFQVLGSKIYYSWFESDGSYNQIWFGLQTFGEKQEANELSLAVTTQLASTSYDKWMPQIQVVGSKIYYTWYESDGSYPQIWLGTSNLDGTGTTTQKLTNTALNKWFPQFQVVDSKIYYTWKGSDGSVVQLWYGSSNLDGTGTTTIQLTSNPTFNIDYPQLQVVGSKIYYVWDQNDSGGRDQPWMSSSNLDGTGFSSPINLIGTLYEKYYPQLHVADSKIYYTWTEKDNDAKYQIWLATSTLSGTATTTIKLTSTAYDKWRPQFQVFGPKIYYTWYASSSDSTKYQIWLASSNLDGSGTTTAQLTNTAYNKYNVQFQIISSKVYYTWGEWDGSKYQIWLGTSNLDGTGTTTTKLTSTVHSKYYPQFQVVGSKIYYTWEATSSDSTYSQIHLGTNLGYNQFNFREKSPNGSADEIAVTWNGQASITGAATPTIALQVYNNNSSQWETLDSSNTYTVGTDFTLSGSVTSNLAYYYDVNYYAAFRVTQDQREQYLTTDQFFIIFTPVGAAGSLTLANHENGQLSNQFTGTSVTNEELFGFRLTPSGGNVTVNSLTFQLNTRGFTQANLTSAALYIDYDGDKTKDPEDLVRDGAGTVSVSGAQGTITFTSFTATTSRSYLLLLSVANIKPGHEVQISLPLYGLNTNATVVTGYTSPASHYTSGGYGSGGSSVGNFTPTGEASTGGTTPTAGEEIGSEPGYLAPTATSGQWSGSGNGLASDGQYDSAASPDLNQDYTSFSFNVPASNTVQGIIVKAEASATGGAGGTIQFKLSYDNGSGWSSTKQTSSLTTSDVVYTLGGPGDTWGWSWTVAQTGNTLFVLRAVSQPSANTVRLDAVQVKVYHVTGGSSGGGGGGEI